MVHRYKLHSFWYTSRNIQLSSYSIQSCSPDVGKFKASWITRPEVTSFSSKFFSSHLGHLYSPSFHMFWPGLAIRISRKLSGLGCGLMVITKQLANFWKFSSTHYHSAYSLGANVCYDCPNISFLARSWIRDDPNIRVYWNGRTGREPNYDHVYLGYGRSAGLFQHRQSAGTPQIRRTVW